MLPGRVEALLEQLLEVLPARAVEAADDFHVVQGQLERCSFKAHIPARRVGKHESKVNMNEMAIAIDQDIAVVPVLDLQQESDDGISGKGLDKVALSSSKASGISLAVCLLRSAQVQTAGR